MYCRFVDVTLNYVSGNMIADSALTNLNSMSNTYNQSIINIAVLFAYKNISDSLAQGLNNVS